MSDQEYIAGSLAMLGFATFALARVSVLSPRAAIYWQAGGLVATVIGIIWLVRAAP